MRPQAPTGPQTVPTAELAAATGAVVDEQYGVTTADVTATDWEGAVRRARDALGLDLLDLLAVVDELPDGFDVVVRLWSVAGRRAAHLRTRLPRQEPTVASLTGVYTGAAWHERQAAEMFGVVFTGHPAPGPLLLAVGGADRPLRKEHPLARRSDRTWPGADDPAYRGAGGRPPRRRLQPPGAS